jgi:meckelin
MYAFGNILYFLFDTWSAIFFWYLVGVSGYWFIMFKLQNRASVLLPWGTWWDFWRPYDILYGLVASSKLVVILLKILMQTSYDIFLIDWEKPKKDPKTQASTENVNVWRTIFLTNEMNELQNTAHVTIEFTYFIYIFFVFGLGWFNWGLEYPGLGTAENDSDFNRVLFFFWLAILLLMIGGVEYIIHIGLSIWIPLKAHDFTDLCSVANLSVIMFDEILHGYYIHGQSPAGIADTDGEELKRILESEGKGGGRNRGLDPTDSSGLQCFEIYIPGDMRKRYDSLYSVPLELEIEQLQRTGAPGAIGK